VALNQIFDIPVRHPPGPADTISRQLAAIQPLRKPTRTSSHVRRNHLCDLGERVRDDRGSFFVHTRHSGWFVAYRCLDALAF
jgi:hypothetical protein